MEITNEQIRLLASDGIGLKAVAATLGRPLTADEQTIWRKTHAQFELREKKRKLEKRNAPKLSEAERLRKLRARAADIEIPAVANPKRRARCKKSLYDFAKTYCTACDGGLLEDPPPLTMKPIIDALQQAVVDGGKVHIRMPRGHGKTSFVKCAIIYACVYGFRRYVVTVSARADDAASLIDDIWNLCESSQTFAEDFPEYATPMRALEGKTQRAKSLTVGGERVNLRKNASRIQFPTVAGAEGSGAVLDAVGITGKARGKIKGSLRPDFLIVDDPQDDKEALNESRVKEKERLIDRSFLGLAGHKKQIAALMTSTPIEPNDLSEIYARKKGWKTFTFRLFKSWPKSMGTATSLWEQYADLLSHEIAAGQSAHIACNKFYRAHRKEMDEGAEVLNAKNYDRATEVSAIQHGMNLYFAVGEDNFNAEYQMKPAAIDTTFRISSSLITSRVRKGTIPGYIPEDTVLTVACTDLNPSYGFSTSVVCFNRAMSAFVTAYHVFPTDIHDSGNLRENAQRVYAALTACGREIAKLGIRLDAWGIDGSGTYFETVQKFARNAKELIGIDCTVLIGRASTLFNPYVRTRIRDAVNNTVLCGDRDADGQKRRWVVFNADIWKESAHAAWNQELGADGGCSLFDGGVMHDGTRGFATQIANEWLESKREDKGKWRYNWKTKEPHDFGDCMAMSHALAAHLGFSATGEFRSREKRKAKLVTFRRAF